MKIFSISAVVIFFVSISINVYAGEVFDLPASKNWTKVQDDGELVQWSVVVPKVKPLVRIDFLSQKKDGKWDSFYTVRQQCITGKNTITLTIVKVGAVAGLGNDCGGRVGVNQVKWLFDEVNQLPDEAQKLL